MGYEVGHRAEWDTEPGSVYHFGRSRGADNENGTQARGLCPIFRDERVLGSYRKMNIARNATMATHMRGLMSLARPMAIMMMP